MRDIAAGPRLNAHVVKSTVVGALGGLLFGFDTAVIAGTTHALTLQYQLTPRALGLTVSIALWGTVLGAISSGMLGQRIGGRNALRIMALLYLVSALACAFAVNWPMLVVARFIGGLGIGGSSVLGPVYIAEIAPASWRGRLVGMFQINIVVGILLAYLSNYAIGTAGFGAHEWRWQLGVTAVPALLFLLMLFGIPQSPRWLVTQERTEEARRVLADIGSSDPDRELRIISEAVHASAHRQQERQQDALFRRCYRLPIFLAITIGLFNQLSGINAILYYLNDIFHAAGFSKVSGDLQAVAVGAMNLIATLLAMTVIDKLGRKKLLLIGSVGTAICLAAVANVFYSNSHQNTLVWWLVAYIAFFAMSQGAVIWVYISEVFPSQVRSKGQSLGSSSHWIMNAIVSFAFPTIAARSGGAPFVFFAAMMVLQFFVVLFIYPETKQASLEQLQHQLGIQ